MTKIDVKIKGDKHLEIEKIDYCGSRQTMEGGDAA
jgi:hypothetical protein